MSPELRLQQRLSQQLTMTPQLQQAIKLLALSHLEMAEALAKEATDNPVLELEEPRTRRDASSPMAQNDTAQTQWEGFGRHPSAWADTPHPADMRLACHPTLADALLWQLTMEKLTPEERLLTTLIVEELLDNGRAPEHLVSALNTKTGIAPVEIKAALNIVQELEPPGVAARSLIECLVLQAQRLMPGVADTIKTILINHQAALERRQFSKIARSLQSTEAEIKRAVAAIRRLNPYPGGFWGHPEAQPITPDVFIRRQGDTLEVVLNESELPSLRIHESYRGQLPSNLNSAAKTYVQEKLRQANFFLRSIAMRKKTLIRVTRSIVKFQRDFFDQGPKYLKPLVMRDVASDVELHESTISRVTTNKYVHTSRGIFELKYFFNSSIRALDGEGLASEAVRGQISQLISQENTKAPYSDQQLVEILRGQDIDIARRTIAKYREILKIPSSARRRRN